MAVNAATALAEQRRALREQMLAQRIELDRQLSEHDEVVTSRRYPRSKTMRFMTRNSGLLSRVLTRGVAVMVGARLFKSQGLGRVAMALLRRRY